MLAIDQHQVASLIRTFHSWSLNIIRQIGKSSEPFERSSFQKDFVNNQWFLIGQRFAFDTEALLRTKISDGLQQCRPNTCSLKELLVDPSPANTKLICECYCSVLKRYSSPMLQEGSSYHN
ncbi:hypothetical protein CSKR_109001 [Clonorchis sinensis]|uniref:Uncharacterized protein n=1 Tax=Clonorchis sinensis TaxID=79923 RepID=A0A3R7CZY5_CLOSI|nr:hypothetical protein CSKR_109001 [Clonorchis sinensis]